MSAYLAGDGEDFRRIKNPTWNVAIDACTERIMF